MPDSQISDFSFLSDLPAATVSQLLADEPPIVTAAVLTRLTPIFRTKVTTAMSDDMRQAVITVLRQERDIPEVTLVEIAKALREKLGLPEAKSAPTMAKTPNTNAVTGATSNKHLDSAMPTKSAGGVPNWRRQGIVSAKEHKERMTGTGFSTSPAVNKIVNSADQYEQPDADSKTVSASDHKTFVADDVQPWNPPHLGDSSYKPANLAEAFKTATENAKLQDHIQTRNASQDVKKELGQPAWITPSSGRNNGVKDSRQSPTKPAPKSNKAIPLDGLAIAAAILRNSPKEVRQLLQKEDPQLYSKLKRRMFVFDDLASAPDQALIAAINGVTTEQAVLALRFGPDGIAERALKLVSSRVAKDMRQLLDKSVRGISVRDIDSAQQAMLDAAIAAQAKGKAIVDPNEETL